MDNWGYVFVGFLFAVAIEQAAIKLRLLEPLLSWNLDGLRWEYLATVSHVALAIVVITTSWVGWTVSQAKGRSKPPQTPFGIPYLVFVIDLLLVVAYFLLATTVEDKDGAFAEKSPTGISAAPESITMVFIYLLYACWDFFADAIPKYRRLTCSIFTRGLFCEVAASLASLFVAALIALVFLSLEEKRRTWQVVCFFNLAEIANTFMFRAAKGWEGPLMERLLGKKYRKKRPKEDDLRRWFSGSLVAAGLFFCAAFVAAYWIELAQLVCSSVSGCR